MSVILQSSGGGQITLQEPTTASNFTQTLPASTGTILTTGSPQSGGVIQVVNAQFDNPSQLNTSSTSAVSTILTLSITPKFATSKILVFSNTQIKNETIGTHASIAIYRNGSTSLGWNSWAVGSTSGNWVPATNISYDSPNTTSSTTYTMYVKASASSISVFWGSGSSSTITAMEIAA